MTSCSLRGGSPSYTLKIPDLWLSPLPRTIRNFPKSSQMCFPYLQHRSQFLEGKEIKKICTMFLLWASAVDMFSKILFALIGLPNWISFKGSLRFRRLIFELNFASKVKTLTQHVITCVLTL